jgi:hypothetical protein
MTTATGKAKKKTSVPSYTEDSYKLIKKHTASMLERDWKLPREIAESFTEIGHWKDNGDGTISFTAKPMPYIDAGKAKKQASAPYKIPLDMEHLEIIQDLSRACGLISAVADVYPTEKQSDVLRRAENLIQKYLP